MLPLLRGTWDDQNCIRVDGEERGRDGPDKMIDLFVSFLVEPQCAAAEFRSHDYVIYIVLIRSRVAYMPHICCQDPSHHGCITGRARPAYPRNPGIQFFPRFPAAQLTLIKETELRQSAREKSTIVDGQPKVCFRSPFPQFHRMIGLTGNSLQSPPCP